MFNESSYKSVPSQRYITFRSKIVKKTVLNMSSVSFSVHLANTNHRTELGSLNNQEATLPKWLFYQGVNWESWLDRCNLIKPAT